MGRETTITYEDGHEETFPLKPKHMIAAERVLGKPIMDHAIEGSFLAAWKASRSPLKFDDWLDGVESVTQTEGEDVDPTPPESSPDE